MTTRPFLATLCLAAALACRASTTAPPAAPPASAPVKIDDGRLPAGLCFQPGYLSRVDGCSTQPHAAAVVLGVYATAEIASQALRAVSRSALPAGYPLAVHVDEVGLLWPQTGIAVLAGLFSNDARAQAWMDAHAAVLRGA